MALESVRHTQTPDSSFRYYRVRLQFLLGWQKTVFNLTEDGTCISTIPVDYNTELHAPCIMDPVSALQDAQQLSVS